MSDLGPVPAVRIRSLQRTAGRAARFAGRVNDYRLTCSGKSFA